MRSQGTDVNESNNVRGEVHVQKISPLNHGIEIIIPDPLPRDDFERACAPYSQQGRMWTPRLSLLTMDAVTVAFALNGRLSILSAT